MTFEHTSIATNSKGWEVQEHHGPKIGWKPYLFDFFGLPLEKVFTTYKEADDVMNIETFRTKKDPDLLRVYESLIKRKKN